MTSNESKLSCGWCEDSTAKLILFSKANGRILGFCNEACWSSYSEIIFKDQCLKCNKKAQLLSVPAANRDDLDEEFSKYCDDCFSNSNCLNSKNKKETVNTTNNSVNDSINKSSSNQKNDKSDLSTSLNDSISKTSSLNNSIIQSNVAVSSPTTAATVAAAANTTSATTPTASATKKYRTFKNQPYEIWGCFNWDDYLKLDGSSPAPNECFNQNNTPPDNEFELNMKLEAPDPRNSDSTCIATVVSKMGFRIELRLDGTDNTNDFWLPVDSDKIHPIGYINSKGGMLQPPLGFRKNPVNWPVFVTQTLNNAVRAPDSCFKPPPRAPDKNFFKVGFKLEAVDKKNPRLICPATITKIKDSMVFVSFDGWKGAFDYWVRFDSRDLFPVGWCQASNHPLQLPGNKDLGIDSKLLTINSLNKITYQTTNKLLNRTPNFIMPPISQLVNNNKATDDTASDTSTTANDKEQQTKIHIKSDNNATSTIKTPPTTTIASNENKTTNGKDTSSIKTPNNQSSSPSPSPLKTLLLDKDKQQSKIILEPRKQDKLPSKITLEPRKQVINGVANKTVINTNLNNTNNSKSDAITPKSTMNQNNVSVSYTTLSSVKNSNLNNSNKTAGNASLIKVDGVKPEMTTRHPLVTVYINVECNAGKYIESNQFKSLVSQFKDSKLGPSPLNKTMRDILQLIVDSCANKQKVLGMIRAGNGNFAVETIVDNMKVKINLPHFNRSSAFWNYLNNFLGGLDCCKNLVQQDVVNCKTCPTNKESLQTINLQPQFQNLSTKQQQHAAKKLQQQLQQQQQQVIKQTNSIVNKNVAANLPKNITVNLNAQDTGAKQSPNYNIQSAKNLKRKSLDDVDGIKINSIKIVKTASNNNLNNLNNLNSMNSNSGSNKSSTPNSSAPLNSNGHFKGSNSSLNSLELNQSSLSDPNDWTTEDVISFLKINDSSLDYGELFKQHEIDGKAFLLLNSDMLMKYMKIKLGPALKISSIIEKLKTEKKI